MDAPLPLNNANPIQNVSESAPLIRSLKNKEAVVDNDRLKDFVLNRIKAFGGTDLLSAIEDVQCGEGLVQISLGDKSRELEIHASLFLCGKLGNVECGFVSV